MNGNEPPIGSDGTESVDVHSLFRTELADGIDDSDVFHILGNDRRREIIYTLTDENEALPVSDLARRIASEEVDGEPSKNLYKSVYVSLQQTHLPKLAEKEIVVYDRDAQCVETGPTFSQVQPYLVDTGRQVPTLQLVVPLFLSALGLLVALGLAMRVSLLQGVGAVVVGAIFLLIIIVLVASRP